MPVSFKAKEGYYEETKASIQQGIERLRKLPQTEEIKQSLKKIDETLALVKTYEQGVNCTVNFVSDISVEGNILTSGPRIIQSSNCPGNQSKPTQQVDRSEFLVEGRTLTVKSLKPTDRDNQACPKGDNVTTILERF